MARIGFSIFGNERDGISRKDTRWGQFRPTVAFALQPDVQFDRMVIAWQPDQKSQEDYVEILCKDIESMLAVRTGNPITIEKVAIQFKKPWDFNESYKVISETLRSLIRDEDTTFYMHMNTGTHAMHFAMYIIAEQRLLPAQLVQTFPDNDLSKGKKIANTIKSHAQIIDLSWAKYPYLKKEVEKSQLRAYKTIVLVETKHQELRTEMSELAMVGSTTNERILLLGPTGSGKTEIVKKIHAAWCERANRKPESVPFKHLNCAGLPPTLAESLLFGHAKGIFTGAHKDQKGVIEEADKGTLFLDEIGDLDLNAQANLLTALDNGKFYRVGDYKTEYKSDFRLICATNKDLNSEVKRKTFREDLYARIRTFVYWLPGLKERYLDIDANIDVALELWHKKRFEEKKSPILFDNDARRKYLQFAQSDEASWKTNFRDLNDSIARMAAFAGMRTTSVGGSGNIDVEIVDREIMKLKKTWKDSTSADGVPLHSIEEIFDILYSAYRQEHPSISFMNAVEYILRRTALERAHGNKAEAARLLYEPPGKALSNPTSKFNATQGRLMKAHDSDAEII